MSTKNKSLTLSLLEAAISILALVTCTVMTKNKSWSLTFQIAKEIAWAFSQCVGIMIVVYIILVAVIICVFFTSILMCSLKRIVYFKYMFNVYCKRYNLTGWKLEFKYANFDILKLEIEKDRFVGAYVHYPTKTMCINTDFIFKAPIVSKGYIRDLFLHEFAHMLVYEECWFGDVGCQLCIGVDDFVTHISMHGRDFRKMCYKLGVNKQCIPNYNNEYINPKNEVYPSPVHELFSWY